MPCDDIYLKLGSCVLLGLQILKNLCFFHILFIHHSKMNGQAGVKPNFKKLLLEDVVLILK